MKSISLFSGYIYLVLGIVTGIAALEYGFNYMRSTLIEWGKSMELAGNSLGYFMAGLKVLAYIVLGVILVVFVKLAAIPTIIALAIQLS